MSLIKCAENMEQDRIKKKRNKQKSLEYYKNKQKYDDIINNIIGE